jgi:bacterioferritin-associated ferredoxin
MYICICNAIREKDLRRAACEQGGDAETLYAQLGFAPQCRQCLEEAAQIVAEVRACQPA